MSRISTPTVTLVTPTLDAVQHLPEMLDSVRAQRWPDLEHLAVDGGSTDGTIETLTREPGVTVIHQESTGLYAALNDGVARARGELIGFVNADDLLVPGALRTLVAAFDRDPSALMVSGGGTVFGASGVVRVVNDPGVKQLREQDVTHGFPMLNARLYRRSLLERVGPFDTRWPRCPDHELLLRVVDARPARGVVDQVVYRYRAHPGSLTFRRGLERDLMEEIVAMTTVRLEETKQHPRLHRRFRRWHTWAETYLALRHTADRDLRGAARDLWAGLCVDPLLPVVASMQVAQHLRMRAHRR